MENQIRRLFTLGIVILAVGFTISKLRDSSSTVDNSTKEGINSQQQEDGREGEEDEEIGPVEVSSHGANGTPEKNPGKPYQKSSSSTKRSLASALPEVRSRDLRKYLSEEFPGNWTYQESGGEIFRVLGGKIPFDDNAGEIATKLSEAYLGHQNFELQEVPMKKQDDHHFFQQQCNGYDVFKGSIRLFSSKNGTVYIVNTELFPIDCKQFQPVVNLTFDDAMDAAKTKYGDRFYTGESSIRTVSQLMIWAADEPFQMAYLMRISLADPVDIREMVISAADGSILADNDLIVE